MAALTLVVVLVLYRCATTDSVHPRRQQQVLNALLPYGIDFHIGQRPYMEDRHVVAGEVGGDACQSFYGVFDGHGGWRAAEYCQLHLSTQVEEMLARDPEPSKALVAAFEQTDREVSVALRPAQALQACRAAAKPSARPAIALAMRPPVPLAAVRVPRRFPRAAPRDARPRSFFAAPTGASFPGRTAPRPWRRWCADRTSGWPTRATRVPCLCGRTGR